MKMTERKYGTIQKKTIYEIQREKERKKKNKEKKSQQVKRIIKS